MKYGHITADQYGGVDGQVERVTLNGEDVTNRCIVADDELGYVDLLVKDADGHFIDEGDDLRREHRHGVVEITMKESAASVVE